jgi:hypothetical protein
MARLSDQWDTVVGLNVFLFGMPHRAFVLSGMFEGEGHACSLDEHAVRFSEWKIVTLGYQRVLFIYEANIVKDAAIEYVDSRKTVPGYGIQNAKRLTETF